MNRRSVVPKSCTTAVRVEDGKNHKTGEPQWQAREERDGKDILLVVDRRSPIEPEKSGQIFRVQYARELHVSEFHEIHTVFLLEELAEMPAPLVVPEVPVTVRVAETLKRVEGITTLSAPKRQKRVNKHSQNGPAKGPHKEVTLKGESRDAKRRQRKRARQQA